jgi:hypothetical protein
LIVNQNWYLFLYNLQKNVLGVGGAAPTFTETINQYFPSLGSSVVLMDDSSSGEDGSPGPPGPPGPPGTSGPQGIPGAAWFSDIDIDPDSAALSVGATYTPFLSVPGPLSLATPVTVTTATYLMGALDSTLIFNTAVASTITLLPPSSWPGRLLFAKNVAAFAVASATSNVVPINSTTPGTAFLAGTAGTFAMFQSDGANWNQIL